MLFESRSMRIQLDLLGGRKARCSSHRRPGAAWIIGILAVVLLTSGSAFGQFIVQPMKVEMGVQAGKKVIRRLVIENLNPRVNEKVDLRLTGMTQDEDGIWQIIEPDAQVTQDPNGAKWVTVDRPENQGGSVRLDIQRLRSCEKWLRLKEDIVELGPVQRKFVDLEVTVPPGTRGYYCAALMAQTTSREERDAGRFATVVLEFLIPVIIEVQGRPVRHEVKLTDVGLRFRPQESLTAAASLVTLAIDNPGGTYSRLVGVARVWRDPTGKGKWRKITEQKFLDTGIIPGVTLNLKQDVGHMLASGKYKVQGILYVDGKRGKMVEREVDFAGDPRVMTTRKDAALYLNPVEQTVETVPGATRGATMRVINPSEETVIVDVEAVLPDVMRQAGIVDPFGRTIGGDEMGCGDWLEISPKRFELRGNGQRNLRIRCKVPESAAGLPNHYATINLKATYPDGQQGGITKGRVYVTTRGAQVAPKITPRMLNIVESAPLRYLVRAQFVNAGTTHVLPRCRAVLQTAGIDSQIRKRVDLSSDIYEQSGNLLPCEVRTFSGVLDMSDVSVGEYRLTAIMEYGAGGSTQQQMALQVSEVGGQKRVVVIGLEAIGGLVKIEL